MSDPPRLRSSASALSTLVALLCLAGAQGCSGCGGRFRTAIGTVYPHPQVLYSVETDVPWVALTIDDGPDPNTTGALLDVLRANDARATFFLIASRVSGNEAIVGKILSEGHEIGNHMLYDRASIDLADEDFEARLMVAHAILSVFGELHWFRPGSGWYDDEMLTTLARHGYRCALGSVYPFDAHIPSVRFARRVILWSADPGEVIVLHDGGERGRRTAKVLAHVLPELKRKGYRITTLSELVEIASDSTSSTLTSPHPTLTTTPPGGS